MFFQKYSAWLLASMLLAMSGTSAFAEDGKKALSQEEISKELSKYPLTECPVTDEKLNSMGNAFFYQHKGRTVLFCCKMCVHKFDKDSAKYLKKMDGAIIAKQKSNYPLKTCVVSGEKLGTMGEAINMVHDNQLVRFCCKGCTKDFKKDPAKFMKKLEQGSAKKDPKKKSEKKHEGSKHEGSKHDH